MIVRYAMRELPNYTALPSLNLALQGRSIGPYSSSVRIWNTWRRPMATIWQAGIRAIPH